MSVTAQDKPPAIAPWNNPEVRGLVSQGVVALVLVGLAVGAYFNASANMHAHNMPTNFRFWNDTAGFDIQQKMISFSAAGSSYGRAFVVGLLNTLLVSSLGIVLATVLGFTMGIARLSSNFVIAKLAQFYVETFRNIPLLLQLLFWYNAVLKPLPSPRQSIALPGGAFANNRGLILPNPVFSPGAVWLGVAVVAGILLAFAFGRWAVRRQAVTGQQAPVVLVSLALIIGLPVLVFFAAGEPISLHYPILRGFNFVGGFQVYPEFLALLLGLTIYTGTFIAEIVRAGIISVSKGQREAANALGLPSGPMMKLIIIPQAMRVIIPPLTNQFLNLTKNSTLAVAIAYPELAQVFMGTVLNQTGAAVQVVFITMLVYLTISLVTAYFMNIYNKRMALVER